MSAGSDWYRQEDALRGELKRALEAPTLDGYTELREINRGAQGLVYEATQRDTRRKVAIKVLTRGSSRGLREIELAGRLSHPNIVRLYESRQTPDGRIFFAMEYVEGAPLHKYVRGEAHDSQPGTHKPVRDILRLFAKVCDAVNYAHQRGVIHRDLKPDNILVDALGEPHVLDFGVALAAGLDYARAGTVLTRDDQFVGTLAYASPEQVDGRSRDLDTRTDVYSLGLILYQLLTGALPFRTDGALTDLVRAVTESELDPPSVRAARLADGAGGVRRIGHEIDAIVLKALSKEPERRYQSADALANDIRRYLGGEAIEAKRDSALYTLRKTLRRHRIAVGVAAAFLLLLTGAAIALSFLYREARTQAELARQETRRTRAAEDIANQARTEAEEQAEIAATERDRARSAEAGAVAARDEARADELAARRSLYITQVNLAQRAWERHDLRAMRDLLIEVRPEADEEDLRDFDWYYLWRLSRGSAVRVLRGHAREVCAVACSPDATLAATGSADGTLLLWDIQSGAEVATLLKGISWGIYCLAFSPDGKRLAAAGANLTLWNVSTREIEVRVDKGFHAMIHSVAFSPDGRTVATAHGRDGWPGEVRLWDAETLTEQRRLSGHTEEVWSVAFSPDGRTLASTSWSSRIRTGSVRFWAVETGTPLPGLPDDHTGGRALALSPDGKSLAVANPDHVIRVWDVDTGDLKSSLTGHDDRIRTLAFDPSGRTLASGGNEAIVKLWDLATAREMLTLGGHSSRVEHVAFTPDGATLLSASRDTTVRVWDVAGEVDRDQLRGHSGVVRSVDFDANGRILASASDDGTAKLWDVETGDSLITLRGHSGPINSVMPSPDGRTVVTGSDDTTVRLWDMSTGQQLETFTGHKDRVQTAAFSSDGRLLASASRDGWVSSPLKKPSTHAAGRNFLADV